MRPDGSRRALATCAALLLLSGCGGAARVGEIPFRGPGRLLPTVEASDAFDRRRPDEILRVDLRSGHATPLHQTPRGVFVTEIDWIEAP